MLKSVRGLMLAVLLTLSGSLLAEGYTELRQQVRPLVGADKIEVVAIFSYTCPHCYRLDPLLAAWGDALPEDVALTPMPAPFNPTWSHYARARYIMEALGREDLHERLFQYMHAENQNPSNLNGLKNFFVQQGVEAATVEQLYESFGVNAKLNRDRNRLVGYGVTAVPALVVDGRYVITGETARGLENMLRVADQLVSQIRAERQ